jgi:SAM-dependent methyltransferase
MRRARARAATQSVHYVARLPACRASGSTHLVPVLSLGEMPLANALRTDEQLGDPEPRYPLELVFAPESALLQLTVSVPPEQLFSEYVYFSSFSDGMLESASALVERLVRERRLAGNSLALEVASNDGYLLQYYKELGVPVLGIEPAANVAHVAVAERGIPTRVEFFGLESARRLAAEGVRADVVHANNVLAHVPDLNGFVEGLRLVLKYDGVAVIEVPYVKDMLDRCEFDTIYHEHLSYFSLTSLRRLFGRHALAIIDAERIPLHGGSLRVFVAPVQPGRAAASRVNALLEEEAAWGVEAPDAYVAFAHRVEHLRAEIRGLLGRLKREGSRLAAYGAAAKGAVLLNYCGIGTETLEYVADRSTVKQGRYMPGVGLRIEAPDRLLADRPDYVLLLAWNFADEIMEQQAHYRRSGGRFVIPIPAPCVV